MNIGAAMVLIGSIGFLLYAVSMSAVRYRSRRDLSYSSTPEYRRRQRRHAAAFLIIAIWMFFGVMVWAAETVFIRRS